MATPLSSPKVDPPQVAEVLAQASPPASTPDIVSGRFAALAGICHRFSMDIAHEASLPLAVGLHESVRDNLAIVRSIFGKWSLEILVITYLSEALGFQELKNSLESISSAVLSRKLRQMEELGLLRREVIGDHPPRTEYSLTPMGLIVARLGEPVFLYLRLRAPSSGRRPADPEIAT